MSEVGIDRQLFASTGEEWRFTYVSFPSGNHKIEYFGRAPIGAATSAFRWFIGKNEYDANECMTRSRTLAVQKAWDDRASLLP